MTDMETLLRETLRSRAQSVAHAPTWTAGPLPPRRRRWVAPLIAAAVVVGLAVTAFVVQQARKPSTGRPAPTIAPTCSTTMPSTWHDQFTRRVQVGTDDAEVLDVTEDADLLVARTTSGSTRDVARIAADGTVHPVYTPVPAEAVMTGSADGSWAVLVLEQKDDQRLPSDQSASRGVAVNLQSGTARTVVTRTGTEFIDGATVYDGTVYYDVRPNDGSDQGSDQGDVHAYDLDSARDTVVARGAVTAPLLRGRGVIWDPNFDGSQIGVRRPVPATVEAQMSDPKAALSVVTDGHSFAWRDSLGRLGYWSPDAPAITLFPVDDGLPVVLVAGPIVVFSGPGGSLRALDSRTGAQAGVPGLALLMRAAHGVFGWSESAPTTGPLSETVHRVDTAELPPELRC